MMFTSERQIIQEAEGTTLQTDGTTHIWFTLECKYKSSTTRH